MTTVVMYSYEDEHSRSARRRDATVTFRLLSRTLTLGQAARGADPIECGEADAVAFVGEGIVEQLDPETGLEARDRRMRNGEARSELPGLLVIAGVCGELVGGSRLWSEPLVWAFATDVKLPAPAPLAFFPKPCPYREAALLELARTSLKWRTVFTSSSLAGARAAALAGLAATPLPRSVVGP